MKITGLDGKIYPWNPKSGNLSNRKQSSYHLLAKHVIKEIYLSDPILEEVSLPGTKPTLFADFIIPLRKLIIEVHGEQHYQRVAQFQGTQKDFFLGQRRDRKKVEWCKINNFFFIELPHWENEIEWKNRILNFGE